MRVARRSCARDELDFACTSSQMWNIRARGIIRRLDLRALGRETYYSGVERGARKSCIEKLKNDMGPDHLGLSS